MKVCITSESRDVITLADMPAVREIQRGEAENTMTPAEYLQMAAHVVTESNERFQIFNACASIAKNGRIWDYYGSNTAYLDIWCEGLAFNPYLGAFWIGAYVSDLNQITGEPSDILLKEHMFIREYLPKD